MYKLKYNLNIIDHKEKSEPQLSINSSRFRNANYKMEINNVDENRLRHEETDHQQEMIPLRGDEIYLIGQKEDEERNCCDRCRFDRAVYCA